MCNKKNYYCIIDGVKHYVHGSTPGQAATALGNDLNRYVAPSAMREVKPSYVYTFWFSNMVSEILAVSEKQAWFYFKSIKGYYPGANITSRRDATLADFKKFKGSNIYDY